MKRRTGTGLLLTTLGVVILATAATAARASGLTAAERRGYERWLAAWRAAPDSLPDRPLFPLGMTAADCASTLEIPRRLVADQALCQLEDALSRAWDTAPYHRFTPALKTARDYRTIGLYTEALSWYDIALAAAPDARRPALTREVLAVTVVAGDSLQFLHRLLDLLGRADLTGYDDALVLAYRHLLATGDRSNLTLLQEKVAHRRESVGTPVLLWHAVSLVAVGRDAAALSATAQLVRRPVPPRLDPRLAAWVVQALPDLLLVDGQRAAADSLYRRLAAGRDRRPPTLWARYQQAWSALLDGRYGRARELVTALPETPDDPWRDRASRLADWAGRLAAVAAEGRRYGTDRLHRR